jgi:hypothetical protein
VASPLPHRGLPLGHRRSCRMAHHPGLAPNRPLSHVPRKESRLHATAGGEREIWQRNLDSPRHPRRAHRPSSLADSRNILPHQHGLLIPARLHADYPPRHGLRCAVGTGPLGPALPRLLPRRPGDSLPLGRDASSLVPAHHPYVKPEPNKLFTPPPLFFR